MSSTETNGGALSAKELQSIDPKRFQKEYSKWVEYGIYDEWWDYIESNLKEELAPFGVTTLRLHFSLGYSQSDYATFSGTIHVAEWMAAAKDGDQTYAEKYPAMYLDALDDGYHASISAHHRGGWGTVVCHDHSTGNTYPSGIFQHLDQESWDALVEEQFAEANIEHAMQEWVQDRSKQLYRELQDDYEHLTSEESFIESCECNDITFEIEESDHEIFA